MKKRVLLIPDAFYNNQSGALVAKDIARILYKSGNEVGVFIENSSVNVDLNKYVFFEKYPFIPTANWLESRYKKQFINVIEVFKPDKIFFIGLVVNKNICYFHEAKKRNIGISVMPFIQDFFCNRLYANLENGPCTKCLDSGYKNAFINKCNANNIIEQLKLLNNIYLRKRIKKVFKMVDYVVGSTDEQLEFYSKFGVTQNQLLKSPLFFNRSRVQDQKIVIGDYFVCSGQDRLEKGIHLLKFILPYCSRCKILLVFSDNKKAIESIEKYDLSTFIENGQLKVLGYINWESGLSKLYAESRGIINLSIWPTTTEYALLEALGYKKPVICFDVGIHSETIKNGVNGYKVPIGQYQKFGHYIEVLSSNDSLHEKLSLGAFKLFKELTSKEAFENSLNLILNK